MTIPTPTRAAGRAISIVLIVLGAIASVFAIGGGVADGIAAHGSTDQSWTASADGVDELRVASSAADFDVVFADVEDATLVASSTGGPVQQWRLERSGDALVVEPGWRWDGFGFGVLRFGDRGFGDEHVTLTLPTALERSGLDLVADISAGSFTASADWGRAELDLSAGSTDFGGTAGVGFRFALGESGNTALRLDVEDYFYNGDFGGGDEFQNDLVASVGLSIGLGGSAE